MILTHPAARLLWLLACLALASSQALAQGAIRTQGRDVTPGPSAGQRPGGDPGLGLRDYREDMRMFVQNIGEYAREARRGFIVVAKNGAELLQKRQWEDETQTAPARTYMRSLDAILVDGLFYGVPEIGKPTEDTRRDFLLPLVKLAKDARLPVLVMDYAEGSAETREAFARITAERFVPFIAQDRGYGLNRLPPYARTPWGVNPDSIVSLAGVKNFVVLRDSSGFGRQDEFALAMHDTNFDMVVVDVFHGRTPLSPQAVETLRYKKLGSKRLVLARIDIGFAESFAHYWQDHWEPGTPAWIGESLPGEPDRYRVEFWRPEWQVIIFGNPQSYIAGLMELGFDGAVLDGLDAFYFFEGVSPPVDIQP